MSVDYLVCDHCGKTFPDCCEYYLCECERVFCQDCAKKVGLKFSDDEDCYSDPESCIYCRKEAFTNYDKLQFLMKKYNLTDEQIEEEMRKEEK